MRSPRTGIETEGWRTRRFPVGLIALFSILLAACQPVEEGVPVDRFQAGQSGRVSFPTRHVEGINELYHGGKGYNARTLGELFLPAAKGRGQVFCAMVILHGSGGEWSGRGKRHAAFLAENGVAAFVVDTFEGRGLSKKIRYMERLRRANLPDQVADAFAALNLLVSHPDIDADCIGVMGYSLGGISTFFTAFEEVATAASRTGRRFALHVPFYAPCAFRVENTETTGAPILALWGEKDETTDRAACDALVRDLEKGGSPVTVHWLKGAAHGWNGLKPMVFYPDVPRAEPCQFVVMRGGVLAERISGRRTKTDAAMVDVLNECSGLGYTIGHHAEADREANRLLLGFIRRKRL
jgi:dienelactone hydrolase